MSINKNKCHSNCSDEESNKEYLGYIGAMVAIIFFGSNFVPVKRYETGDGECCSHLLYSQPNHCDP